MPAPFSPSLSRLLASTSVSALLLAGVLATPARAAETIIANGVTATQQVVQPGDTLTVQAGGKIDDAANDAVLDNLPGTITINNQGLIQSTTKTAIKALNSQIVVDNSGLVLGQMMGIEGDAGITSINNTSTGTIGGGTSLGVFGFGIGIIDNAGTIQGITAIKSSSDLATLYNSGDIQGASGYGVQSPNINTLTNTTGATITGDTGVYTAVHMGALVNAGTIEGVTSGTVSDGTIGTLDNSGTIKGDTIYAVSATTITTLTNATSGLIDGAGTGIYATNIATLANAGTIKGVNQGVLSAGGTIDSLTNSGLIQGGAAGQGVGGKIITLVVNEATGTITGGALGLQADTLGTLINKAGGTISGHDAIVLITLADRIENAGTIQGSGTGIFALGAINTVINSGTIAGTTANGLNAASVGSVDNSGTISSTGVAFLVGDVGLVTNSGTIAGGDGVKVTNMTTLTNTASGTISGATALEILTQADTINNAGSITGTSIGINGSTALIKSLVNSGDIVGTGNRGLLVDTIQSLTNSGTISGQDGMRVTTLGALTNTSTGKITGSAYGLDAVTADSIDNAGTISAGKGMNIGGTLTALVNSGSIVGTSQSAIEAGPIGTIDNRGNISGKTWGIYSGAGGISGLINSKTISGETNDGVYSIGSIGSISNSGDITSIAASGIWAQADIGSVTNNGTIRGGYFANQAGIVSGGTVSDLSNSGTISGYLGVYASTAIVNVSNAGAISGATTGLYSLGTLGNVTNSGTIDGNVAIAATTSIDSIGNTGTVTGGTLGIYTGGILGTLVNSGKIIGGTHGVAIDGLLSLTNSGTIAAATPSDFAILEANPALATNTVLNLNAGSILIGHVDIHGGTNTLNVGPGLNLALTFDTGAPEVINAGGSAMVVIGNTVYVADPSTVARAGDAAANLSGGIAGLVDGALDKGFDEKGIDGSGHYWLDGVGGVGSEPGKNGGPALRNGFAGFAVGADFGPDADTRFGGFAGAARGIVDNGALTSNSDNFYAGVYAGVQFDDFSVKGSLTAGTSHSTGGTRVVANNTVATGLEAVNGSSDAYFVSPSVVLTKPWVTPDLSFETSLALNYTGVFAGAYSEGSATGLNMDAATTHVFTATGLVTLPMQSQTENALMSGDVHAGLEGRAVLNPDLNGTLAGTSFNFASASVTTTAGIVAGGALAFRLDGGLTLFGGLDGALRTDKSLSALANLGIKGDF